MQYGIGVPEGYPAFTPEEAEQAAKKLGMSSVLIFRFYIFNLIVRYE
jgi:succinyl-CoA synthetase beta subunit